MLSFLWKRKTAAKASPHPAPHDAHVPAPPASRAAPAAAPPEESAPEPLEHYLALLKIELPPRAPPAPAAEERDDALALAVLDHYSKNRPQAESFPALSLQVINLIAAPDVDATKLGKLVAQDPGLSATVLRVANSAVNKGVDKIESVRDAIARLGLNEVARVAGAASARALFDPATRRQFAPFASRFAANFHQSVTCAMTAAWLALEKPPARADRAYFAGLLHDIGRSIALRSVAQLIADGTIDLQPDAAHLPRVIERVQREIGADVHRAWKLPDYLVEIAVAHQAQSLRGDPESADLNVVRLVSSLELLRVNPSLHPHAPEELWQSAIALKVSPHELRTIDAELCRFADRAAALVAG